MEESFNDDKTGTGGEEFPRFEFTPSEPMPIPNPISNPIPPYPSWGNYSKIDPELYLIELPGIRQTHYVNPRNISRITVGMRYEKPERVVIEFTNGKTISISNYKEIQVWMRQLNLIPNSTFEFPQDIAVKRLQDE